MQKKLFNKFLLLFELEKHATYTLLFIIVIYSFPKNLRLFKTFLKLQIVLQERSFEKYYKIYHDLNNCEKLSVVRLNNKT
jgi:hypothetical protein